MPTTDINLEAKELLARLLAGENIWIRHAKVRTASFNLVKRILTLPMWEDMSDVLYTMLIGHEIGHALYDDQLTLLEFGKKIDPSNPKVAAGYWNVVADARIERLTSNVYPGLRPIYVEGYKELYDRGFFGDIPDVSQLCLVDRINLQFKMRHNIIVPFSPDEQVFVDKVANTLSKQDVVDVAKEIYEWSKLHNELPQSIDITDLMEEIIEQLKKAAEKPPPDPQSGDIDNDITPPPIIIRIPVACDDSDEDGDEGNDEGDGGGKGEEDPKEKKPSKGKGKGKPKDKDSKDGGDGKPEDGDGEPEDGDGKDGGDKSDDTKPGGNGGDEDSGDNGGSSSPSDGDQDGDGNKATDEPGDSDGKGKGTGKDGDGTETDGKPTDGNEKGQPGEQASTGKQAEKPVNPGPPPVASTQEQLDKHLEKLIDPNAAEMVYVNLPKADLQRILVDYKIVHSGIRQYHFPQEKSSWRKTRTEVGGPAVFKRATREFEAFRAANEPEVNYIYQQFQMKKQAARFLRTKRHKIGTLDTLRLHAFKTEDDLFRAIKIVHDGKNHGLIFVVDWSGSMDSSMPGTLEQLIVLCMFCRKASIPFRVYSLTTGGRGDAFSTNPGDLVYAQNFRMRCYLSSEMNHVEFNDACINLFALMPGGQFFGGPTADNLIGCTPLDEAVISTIDIMEEFRKSTNAEVVNAVFLTDGDANTVRAYYNAKGDAEALDHSKRYIIEDRISHKNYEFDVNHMTPTTLTILGEKQDIHVVGFYIGGHWSRFFDDLDDAQSEEYTRQFDEDGYVVCTTWGYSELYITRRGDALRVKDQKIKPVGEKGTPGYAEAIQKAYIDYNLQIAKQHMMLNRFINMIA